MTEADLRLHLAKQTKKTIALFDVQKISLPAKKASAELAALLNLKPHAVLFDALCPEHLERIGKLLESFAAPQKALFSIGSSGIESALAAVWARRKAVASSAGPVKQVLIGSGSCSPVTLGQIAWALKAGFAGISLDAAALVAPKKRLAAIRSAVASAVKHLQNGRSVILYTCQAAPDKLVAKKLKIHTAPILGGALGKALRDVLAQNPIPRICIAGGDTSSYAARALAIEALEMIAPLTSGAPLCRAYAPKSPVHGREIVFKGGQVGAENYFEILKRGHL